MGLTTGQILQKKKTSEGKGIKIEIIQNKTKEKKNRKTHTNQEH